MAPAMAGAGRPPAARRWRAGPGRGGLAGPRRAASAGRGPRGAGPEAEPNPPLLRPARAVTTEAPASTGEAAGLEPTSLGLPPPPGARRPRLVILGSGWGSISLIKQLQEGLYDVVLVSPRNYFLYTPLLPAPPWGRWRSAASWSPSGSR